MRDERTTRICTKCGQQKPTDEFPMKVGSQKQGRRRYRSRRCRECINSEGRAWFARHPEVRPANQRRYWNKADHRYAERRARRIVGDRERRLLNYAFADAERVRGCSDCGEKDIRVLEFDHVRGKVANISTMSLHSTRAFLTELDRCEVVCANCHARRTYQRRLTTRSRVLG